jgi:hypothetical protein
MVQMSSLIILWRWVLIFTRSNIILKKVLSIELKLLCENCGMFYIGLRNGFRCLETAKVRIPSNGSLLQS